MRAAQRRPRMGGSGELCSFFSEKLYEGVSASRLACGLSGRRSCFRPWLWRLGRPVPGTEHGEPSPHTWQSLCRPLAHAQQSTGGCASLGRVSRGSRLPRSGHRRRLENTWSGQQREVGLKKHGSDSSRSKPSPFPERLCPLKTRELDRGDMAPRRCPRTRSQPGQPTQALQSPRAQLTSYCPGE